MDCFSVGYMESELNCFAQNSTLCVSDTERTNDRSIEPIDRLMEPLMVGWSPYRKLSVFKERKLHKSDTDLEASLEFEYISKFYLLGGVEFFLITE